MKKEYIINILVLLTLIIVPIWFWIYQDIQTEEEKKIVFEDIKKECTLYQEYSKELDSIDIEDKQEYMRSSNLLELWLTLKVHNQWLFDKWYRVDLESCEVNKLTDAELWDICTNEEQWYFFTDSKQCVCKPWEVSYNWVECKYINVKLYE